MFPLLLILAQLPPAPAAVDDTISPAHVAERKFVVIHDDGPESRLLVSELTRDWTRGRKCPATMKGWIELQSHVAKSVTLSPRRLAGPEFRHAIDGYPFIRYGERGAIRRFPREAFVDTGTPLLTMHSLIRNETLDLSDWRTQCEHISFTAEMGHVAKLRKLASSFPGEVESGWFAHEWGEADNMAFIRSSERYRHWDGFPVYVEPKLPPRPRVPFPWEDGYVSPIDSGEFLAPPPPESLE